MGERIRCQLAAENANGNEGAWRCKCNTKVKPFDRKDTEKIRIATMAKEYREHRGVGIRTIRVVS